MKNAVEYHYDGFPPKNLDLASFVNELVEASSSIARYDQMLMTSPNAELLLAPLRRREALLSSEMEGTVSTMKELLKFEVVQESSKPYEAGNKTNTEEVFLYVDTLKKGQDMLEGGWPIGENLIKSLHQNLLSSGRGSVKSPGTYKNEQNYLVNGDTGEIKFIPINPERLRDGMEKLIDYVKDENINPLVKAAMSHLEFEALHPFKDGNGRIGRMLLPLMLWEDGVISAPYFYISSYFENSKNRYIGLMRNVSETGNWEEWVKYFLEGITTVSRQSLELSARIYKLYDEMKIQLTDILASKNTILVLDYIFSSPLFSNLSLSRKVNIAPNTAARMTRLLLEHEVIEVSEDGAGNKGTLYAFQPLLDIVDIK